MIVVVIVVGELKKSKNIKKNPLLNDYIIFS